MQRYLDVLSFDVCWEINEQRLTHLLRKYKEHFDEAIIIMKSDSAMAEARKECTAFDRSMNNRLFMTEEYDASLKISIQNGQTKVGITQIADGGQVDELLFIPLMRYHFGAKVESFNQCLPYILPPDNIPFYCSRGCSRHNEAHNTCICFSITRQPDTEMHSTYAAVCYVSCIRTFVRVF